jgi:hypothetical protein
VLSNSQEELPEASVALPAGMGSFDSAAASLRETAAPLRMTIH